MEFSSAQEYLQVFHVPLLEEVRAQLHQALEKSISGQAAGHITTVIRKIVKPNPKKVRDEDKSSKKILEFNLPPKLGAKYSDLILFCSKKPRWNSKRESLVKSDVVFVLGCVVHASKTSSKVCAIVYVENGDPLLTKLKVMSVWHVVLPGVGLTPARRIWEAINMPFGFMEVLFRRSVIHTVLQIDQQVREFLTVRVDPMFGAICKENCSDSLVFLFGRFLQTGLITRWFCHKRKRERKPCDVWKTTAITEA